MVPALKVAALFLALPLLLAGAGRPELALSWAVFLQFPPFFFSMVSLIAISVVSGLFRLRRFHFVAFGFLPAMVVFVMGVSTASLEVGQVAVLAVSTFVPFAAIQFLLALIVRPQASAT